MMAVPMLLSFAAICHGADDPPEATRKIEGRTTQFPPKTIAEGMKLTVVVLESCSASDTETYTAADMKKAQEKDHVRWMFPRPIAVTIDGDTFKASEVVYAAGAFWVRDGEKVVRCAKYQYDKMKPFGEWYRQTLP